MKKLFNKFTRKLHALYVQMLRFFIVVYQDVTTGSFSPGRIFADCRGDLATNTIGAIIVAVVIVGLLVVAINAFFPSFFTDMFNSMSTKLNANW